MQLHLGLLRGEWLESQPHSLLRRSPQVTNALGNDSGSLHPRVFRACGGGCSAQLSTSPVPRPAKMIWLRSRGRSRRRSRAQIQEGRDRIEIVGEPGRARVADSGEASARRAVSRSRRACRSPDPRRGRSERVVLAPPSRSSPEPAKSASLPFPPSSSLPEPPDTVSSSSPLPPLGSWRRSRLEPPCEEHVVHPAAGQVVLRARDAVAGGLFTSSHGRQFVPVTDASR